MFFHKKKVQPKTYDPAVLTPVLRKSICTGETVAGFRDKETGKFLEDCLIQSEKDLDNFRKMYGIEGPLETIY